MATADEANEFLGMLARDVEASLTRVAPQMTFAMVYWVRGAAADSSAIAIFAPPDAKAEAEVALMTASASLGAPGEH